MGTMRRIEITEDQLITIRAVWQYFLEDQEGMAAVGEALGIDEEDRGLDDEGEYTAEDGEASDPLIKRIGEVTAILMKD